MALRKVDIIRQVTEQMDCVKREAEDYVESVLAIMKEVLESGEPLKIAGFGNFVVKQKAARRGRNPQTGEKITLAARRVVIFKVGQKLRMAINSEEEEAPATTRRRKRE
jgi:integration host factor subunit alpha